MTLMMIYTILLIIAHFTILYHWLFDWQELLTEAGLYIWVGSILFGMFLYVIYKFISENKGFAKIARMVLFSTTLMVIILGVLALVIEGITRSMP